MEGNLNDVLDYAADDKCGFIEVAYTGVFCKYTSFC